ncbi:MAG: EAL domain-containing protein, partial [Dehalococcoidia bacterium]
MSLLASAATRVALLYLLVALPWVLGTDAILHIFAPSADAVAWVGMAKGGGFVLVTTTVLYLGLRRWTDSLAGARVAAEASEARLASFIATIDDIVFVTDVEQRFVEVMGPATTPGDRARFLGRRAPDIFGPEVGEAFLELGRRAMAGETVELDWSADTQPAMFPVDSRVTSLHLTLSAIRLAGGSVTGVIGIGRDTSPLRRSEDARHRAERHIQFLENTDPLTGLASRALLEQLLTQAIADAAERGHMVALHVLNLDRFRDVNDSLGYNIGDELLRAVATRVEQHGSPGDIFARLSADDFVVGQVVVQSHDEGRAQATMLGEAFHEVYSVHGHELRASASIGLAFYPENASTALDLLRAADAAMHAAKLDPATPWVCYEPRMETAASDRLEIANELRAAVEHDEIEVAYQPIVRAGDGRILAFEALARWTSPTRGVVPPVVFIPIAEQVGLIDDLGRSVRLQAYRWLAQAHREGFTDLQIEVNVSPHHFLRGSVARLVEEATMAGLDPKHVVLEITESALVDIRSQGLGLLKELTAHGFSLAVDDFGTGYSSLSYL